MKQRHHHGQHPGRSGGWQRTQQPDAGDAAEWFAGRVPDGWFSGDPSVVVDREEITVIGRLPEPEGEESGARASGRAARFREETRSERIRIAEKAAQGIGGQHDLIPILNNLDQYLLDRVSSARL